MIDNQFELKVLKNNENNLKILIALGERDVSKEYHILMGKNKLALVTHYIWEDCDYCNSDCDDKGIIDFT